MDGRIGIGCKDGLSGLHKLLVGRCYEKKPEYVLLPPHGPELNATCPTSWDAYEHRAFSCNLIVNAMFVYECVLLFRVPEG